MRINKLIPFLTLLLILLAACQTEAPQEVDTAEPYTQYGQEITTEGAVPVHAILAEREGYLEQPVKVEGTVTEVCQSMGCWLTFRTEDELMRIHVERDEEEEYAFTVPSDISGRRAIVQGILREEEAADEETVAQLTLTASGVLVEEA